MSKGYRYLLLSNYDYSEDTWVAFDYDGNVTVNISKEDYYEYRENLSFDELCESLGNLFTEFLEMYKSGKGVRIIDRLNDLKICIFT
jgi:hypothetical protein